MPRTKLLVSALALALAGTGTAQAQDFTAVISFGDSLTDAGNVALVDGNPFTPPGSSFTTNPDSVYAELVAQAFGFSGTNSLSGGTNYAFGGACVRANSVTFTCGLSPGSFSLTSQLTGYLAANNGVADPNALYTMWGGANDIFTYAGLVGGGIITPTQAQQLTGLSALTMSGLVGTLQNAGANTIVVFNLPDLGSTPYAAAIGQQTAFRGLTFAYNSTLNDAIGQLGDGIIPINTFALFNEVLADPAAFGFTNTTGTACGTLSGSLACGPAGDPTYFYHWAAGTDTSFLFADGVHPTGGAHRLLANVVLATIEAPGQVSMAGELPLQVYNNHANFVNTNIFASARDGRSKGESTVYGQIQYGRHDFDATTNTAPFDSNVVTVTLGADVRASDNFTFGGAVSFGGTRGDSYGSDIDAKEVLASVFGVAHWGMGYISLMATGGTGSLDIERSIDFIASTRTEHGDTNERHFAGELAGGLAFGGDNLRHGPFLSWTQQRVQVQGYEEDSLDSTAMWFDGFTRNSSVGRIGYQIQGHAGSFRPFGHVAYAKEHEDDVVLVQAGSNTLNGHFTLPGYYSAEDWIEAEAGFGWALNDSTELTASYRGRFNDDFEDYNALTLGFRKEFGVAAPAPVEEVVAEPVQTCADLDDDGDGINNCDDKCPGTASGEAVGPDGCAVPAPEPEMEPKPFRG